MLDILAGMLILSGLLLIVIGARGIYYGYLGLQALRKAEQEMADLKKLWYDE